jgi:hypothetical protein
MKKLRSTKIKNPKSLWVICEKCKRAIYFCCIETHNCEIDYDKF